MHMTVQHRSDKAVRWFDPIEDVNDAVTLLDLTSSRVEEQNHAVGRSSVRIKRRAQIIRHPGTIGPDHSILSVPSFVLNSSGRASCFLFV